jgi:hypothetical protein
MFQITAPHQKALKFGGPSGDRTHDHRFKRRLAECLYCMVLSILVILMRSNVYGIECRVIFLYRRNDTSTTLANEQRRLLFCLDEESSVSHRPHGNRAEAQKFWT